MRTTLIISLLPIFLSCSYNAYSQVPTEHLQLWLRADSVLIEDDKVSRWYDLSENNYLINQSSLVNQPVQNVNVLAGYPVILFNGSTFFNGGDILNFGTNSHTLFIVGSGSGWFLSKSRAANATGRWAISNTSLLYHDDIIRNISFTIQNGINLISYLNSRSSAQNKVYINQNLVGINAINSSFDLLTTNLFLIGAYANATGSLPPVAYLSGTIAEIIVYDRLLLEYEIDSVENYLMNKYSPCFNLGANINIEYTLCDTTLSIPENFYDVLWSTGDTIHTLTVNETGQYFVQARDSLFGRLCYDTIFVQYQNIVLNDTTLCYGDSVLYSTNLLNPYDYLWSTGVTDESVYFSVAGDYWLQITDTLGCFDTVFFSIVVDTFANTVSLGNDTILCSGNSIQLISGADSVVSYNWFPDENTMPWQIVTESQYYGLVVANERGCIASDSIFVTIQGEAPIPSFSLSNLCFGDNTQITDLSYPQDSIANWIYIFNDSDTLYQPEPSYIFEDIGQQSIQLILESHTGCFNDTLIYIDILPKPYANFTYTPACTGVPLDFIADANIPAESVITEYNWFLDGNNIGSNEILSFTFPANGEYELSLEIIIDNGCSDIYTETIIVENSYPVIQYHSLIYPPDSFYVNQDAIVFEWNIAENAISYELIIATDDSFNDPISVYQGISNNFQLSNLPIIDDTIYWKVVYYNPCLISIETESRIIIQYNPSQSENLQYWLHADSVLLIDNKVSQWYDLSANSFEFMQSNPSARPQVLNSELNSKPTINFNGSSTFLDAGNILNLDYSSHNYFFIAKGINGTIFSKSATSGANNRYGFTFSGNTFTWLYHDNTLKNIQYSDASFNNNKYNLYYCSNNRQQNINELYINTVKLAEISISSNHFVNSTFNFLIGAYGNPTGTIPPNSTLFLNGNVSEIIAFDTVLNETEIELVHQYLRHKYSPPVNLGPDIRILYGFCDTTITTAAKPWFTDYLWSTGETDSIITVNKPGIYSVTVTDIFGFESTDQIRVFYPHVKELSDTTLCLGEPLLWDTELEGEYSFSWFGSDSELAFAEFSAPGSYAFMAEDTAGCIYYSDTISFIHDLYEINASLGPADTLLCAGNRIFLVQNAEETLNWLWNTGETSHEIVLQNSGTYSLTSQNWRGCEANNTINVIIEGEVPIPDFETMGHCAQNTVFFTDLSSSPQGAITSWTWTVNGEVFSNQTNPEEIFPQGQTYEIGLAVITEDNCRDFITREVEIFPLPTPDFGPHNFCANNAINFTASPQIPIGTIINNIWEIESEIFTEDNITFFFTDDGNYDIKLISVSDMHCSDSIIRTIEVKPAPLPDFEVSSACLGETVYFINNTQTPIFNHPQSWDWNFGDGANSSNSDPEHTYSASGEYEVSLEIWYLNGCRSVNTQNLNVYSNPTALISQLDACVNQPFSPTEESSSGHGAINLWKWTVQNSAQPEDYQLFNTQNLEFTPGATGNFDISLEVKTEFGCTSQIDTIYNVWPPAQAAFSASKDWGGIPLVVDFTDQSENSDTRTWYFEEGSMSNEQNPQYIFQDSGVYTVQLISYSAYGCSDTSYMDIKAIVPILEIILINPVAIIENNYMQTSVIVINNGTLPANNIDIILNAGTAGVFREQIEQLQPGAVLQYKFNTEIYRASNTLPDLICIEAQVPPFEGHYDINPSNNIICITGQESLKAWAPYPNPAEDLLFFEFFNYQSEDLIITVTGSTGQTVFKTTLTHHRGYQKLQINTSSLSNGLYHLTITNNTETLSFKFTIQK